MRGPELLKQAGAAWTKQMQLDHFFLTRFNVPFRHEGRIAVHRGLDEGWLRGRFALFERYCLGSMQRQTCKDFTWLIFMDASTPEPYRSRILRMAEENGFLRPIFCDDLTPQFELEAVHSRERPGALRVTTRLDNDDAVHPQMVADIQKVAGKAWRRSKDRSGFFIVFPFGFSLLGSKLFVQLFRYNPFGSFVSDQRNPKIVTFFSHTKISDAGRVVFPLRMPRWCQVIHGENLANQLRGYPWPFARAGSFARFLTASGMQQSLEAAPRQVL